MYDGACPVAFACVIFDVKCQCYVMPMFSCIVMNGLLRMHATYYTVSMNEFICYECYGSLICYECYGSLICYECDGLKNVAM